MTEFPQNEGESFEPSENCVLITGMSMAYSVAEGENGLNGENTGMVFINFQGIPNGENTPETVIVPIAVFASDYPSLMQSFMQMAMALQEKEARDTVGGTVIPFNQN